MSWILKKKPLPYINIIKSNSKKKLLLRFKKQKITELSNKVFNNDDLLIEIFKFLSISDREAITLVNKLWYETVLDCVGGSLVIPSSTHNLYMWNFLDSEYTSILHSNCNCWDTHPEDATPNKCGSKYHVCCCYIKSRGPNTCGAKKHYSLLKNIKK